MIFVCVGSRDYQFNRLLKELDDLVKNGEITDKIVAQIGQSEYVPESFECHRFLDRDAFKKYQAEADLIISHAGTGALIGALKLGKQVIAVPRLAKYGEHIDDHQTQISGVLSEEGYLREVLEMNKLGETIKMANNDPIKRKYDRQSNVVSVIEDYLDSILGGTIK